MNQEDKLRIEGILPYLQKESKGKKILLYDSIDSTNNEAKRLALQGEEEAVILAEQQTAGRGRLLRSFYSPSGSGVYLSILLRPKIPMDQMVLVTTAASVAVCRAVEEVTGQSLAIKWVNDLYWEQKKVCGILTELLEDTVIVGVGINCSTVFEGELAEVAGSLHVKGVRCRLAAELINRLSEIETMILKEEFLEEYRRRSMVLGKEITVLQEAESRYLAEDIGKKGELILKGADGTTKVLSSGEISIRLTMTHASKPD